MWWWLLDNDYDDDDDDYGDAKDNNDDIVWPCQQHLLSLPWSPSDNHDNEDDGNGDDGDGESYWNDCKDGGTFLAHSLMIMTGRGCWQCLLDGELDDDSIAFDGDNG